MRVKSLLSISRIKEFLLSLWILGLSIFIFRSHLSGFMLGESVDTRLQVAQLEHWYRLKNGVENFKDVYFFYPRLDGLGFSDSLLLMAIPYSIARVFGQTLVSSWSISTILIFFVGNLGWQILSKYLYKNFLVRFFFVATISISATLITRIEALAAIQAGFSFFSYTYLFIFLLFYRQKYSKIFFYFLMYANFLIILALTFWYVAFFSLLFSMIFFLVVYFNKINKLNISFKIELTGLAKFKNILLILNFIFLAGLWTYIYLPLASEPIRLWDEVYKNSSSLVDTFLSTKLNNGLLSTFFFNNHYYFPQEREIGIPVTFTIFFILIILFWVLKIRTLPKNTSFIFIFYSVLVSLLISLIFMRLGDSFTIYRFFWDIIPGLNSMRAPSRFNTILYFSLILLIFAVFEQIYNKKNRFFVIFLMSMLFIDQLKPSQPRWSESEYVSQDLIASVNFLKKNCDFFILEIPGGWWNDKAQAIGLAQLSRVRSVTGGSGGFPRGYPDQRPSDEGDVLALAKWSNYGQTEKIGCLFLNAVERPMLSNSNELRVVFREGFSGQEQSRNTKWVWATGVNSTLYVVASKKSVPNFELNFELRMPQCQTKQNVQIFHNDKFITSVDLQQRSIAYKITLENSIYGLNKINFRSIESGCYVSGDERELFFELKNFTVRQ